MWNFLLNHWWITSVVPYFGINAWLLWMFERDEGKIDPEDWALKVGFMLLGLPAMAGFIGWFIIGDLLEWLESVVEGRRRPRLDRRRVVRIARWIGFQIVATTLVIIFVLGSAVLFLAITGIRPNRIALLIAFVLVGIVGDPHIKRLINWRKEL